MRATPREPVEERQVQRTPDSIPSFADCDYTLRQLAMGVKAGRPLTPREKTSLNRALQALHQYLAQKDKHALSLWEQTIDIHQKAQRLSFLIYNAGQLASYIDTPLAASFLQCILDRLDMAQQTVPHQFKSKPIANSLYGLGLLARHKKISGRINVGPLLSTLNQLSMPNIQSQNISNSLYGIGLLAQAGNLHDKIDVGPLLLKLFALSNIESQSISNSLYGIGLLAEAGQLHDKIDVGPLLLKLFALPNIEAQHISNSLYGIGLVAQAGQLHDKINLGPLLLKFCALKNINSQAISDTLCGLGKVARAGQLLDMINVQQLLLKLLELKDIDSLPDINSQAISSALHGIGLVAQAGKLQDRINVKRLLSTLLELPDIDSQAISSALQGIGLVAEAGKLQDRINVERLLLTLLELPDIDSKAISSALYGIGLLAEAGQLHDKIDVGPLLLKLFALPNIEAQHISNTLYGIRLLAQARQLHDKINLGPLLLKLLELPNIEAQHISSTLYGIGVVARAGQLHDTIDDVERLLSTLRALPNIEAQHISNALYGIGLLAQTGRLKNSVMAYTAIEKLITLPNINSQDISNSIYALGLLAKTQKLGDLVGVDWNGVISSLIASLLSNSIQKIDAVQVLFGLGELYPAVSFNPQQFEQLFRCVMQASYLHPRDIEKLIRSFVAFKLHHVALNEQFHQLLSLISIPPDGFSLSSREQLTQSIAQLSDVGDWQMALNARLGLTPPTITTSASLTTALRLSAPMQSNPVPQPEHPRVTARTSAPAAQSAKRAAPPRTATWAHCMQYPAFKAIAEKDLNKLMRLLGLSATGFTHRSLPHVSAQASTYHRSTTHAMPSQPAEQPDVSINNKATADAIAERLFKQTDIVSLRQLITESTYIYFASILQACSHHVRYQLAIANALHPIILYLPIAELKPMVDNFEHLELYRDHKALLNLIDALTLRILEHPDKPEEHLLINSMRNKLFERSLAFHDKTNHHRVVSRLQTVKAMLAQPNQTFIDDIEEETYIAPPSPIQLPAAVPSVPSAPSMVATTTHATARTRHTWFAAQPQRPRNPLVNTNYEYDTNDMQAILTARFSQHREVSILPTANMTKGANGNRVENLLSGFIEDKIKDADAFSRLPDPYHLIIPIIDNHHWVGIRLCLIPSQRKINIFYYNSLQQESPDQESRMEILKDIAKLGLLKKLRLTGGVGCMPNPVCLQQDDQTSCGPFLIENMYRDLMGESSTQKPSTGLSITESIRLAHMNALEEHRPDYYPRFQQQQTQGNPLTERARPRTF